jgi:SpoVK/Ycf46/Vps4 family AAA+-type ATPase
MVTIDDKLISQSEQKYKRMIRDTPYGNPYRGGLSEYSQNQDKRTVRESIEKFFTVYGIVKEHAAKYGGEDFSGNYGLFCGSVYGDSFLEQRTGERCSASIPIRIDFEKNEVLLVANLLGQYTNLTVRTPGRDLARTTSAFFRGIAYESEKNLSAFAECLEQLSKEEIRIGAIAFKGLDCTGRQRDKYSPRNDAMQKIAEKEEELPEINPSKFNKISFDDIGGNKSAKEAAKKIIREISRPEVRAFYGKEASKGLILYGPPGTGKTMLARAIASQVDKPMYEVQIDKILDKWLGNSEKQLASLLDKQNSIFFFDEFDSLGRKKEDAHEVTNRLTNLIATKMDGLNSDSSSIYIAATNNPLLIDQKLIRRFNRPIYIGVPSMEELSEILEKQFSSFRRRSDAWKNSKMDIFKDVNPQQVSDIIYQKSQEFKRNNIVGVVGSDIAEIINRSIQRAMEEAYAGKARLLKTDDFIQEISLFKKITPWIESYEEEVYRCLI